MPVSTGRRNENFSRHHSGLSRRRCEILQRRKKFSLRRPITRRNLGRRHIRRCNIRRCNIRRRNIRRRDIRRRHISVACVWHACNTGMTCDCHVYVCVIIHPVYPLYGIV